ncbi:hypothetical protein CC1G_14466 [Coprinopsis cinerea okayama7|uniref:Uncharacterized protein n=1 Tax=Coprinopsis cinerea (strain Okayama-7 / 130 / ATCC MYA-4618 / FGSC 9003) TaxID=240176 RepID=D6RM45_COPC7|nr:hypothetical protein CC1G_14466 [Coprinopsis cinerea okayama7\|eukprot:XP_002911468.1 hypothetical protein CC1G_14466 [Coprinopsis cinerea okayama7\
MTLANSLALVGASQVPLSHHHATSSHSTSWRFDEPLRNTTSNFVFESVSSLLQQWGNTRYRHGHNIVPGTIPIGTLLYHGTWFNGRTVPSTPEWVATDPEHSHVFCRELVDGEGCWMLTLAVTRPLKVLYFDGSSAAMSYGCMDTQDLIVWGEVRDDERVEGV